MQISQLPSRISTPFANSAGSGYVRNIPVPSQIGITDGAASFTDGFPPKCFQALGAGGTPPAGQDFNGLLNLITTWNRWQAAGGTVQFDQSFCTAVGGYPVGAVLASSATAGLFWYNTTDNNTTNPDGVGATGWVPMGPAAPGIEHIGTDTSASVNAIAVASVSPALTTVSANTLLLITKSVAGDNSSAMTFSIAGTTGGTAVTGSVLWADGSAMAAGDWPASTPALCFYNGTSLFILSTMGPSVWARASAVQPILSGSATYYVDASTGSDSNNGLTSGTAFATLQKAADTAALYNLNGYSVTVNVANGTYAPVNLPPINGSGSVSFIGDAPTPSNCIISSSSGSAIVAGSCGNSYTFNGFKLQSSAASGSDPGCGLSATGLSTLTLLNIDFGACQGAHVECVNLAHVTIGGAITISGGVTANTLLAGYHIYCGGNAIVVAQGWGSGVGRPSLTISSSVSIPTFIGAFLCGLTEMVYSSITGSGNVTGAKYSATLNGIIATQSSGTSYYPVNTSGSTATGGQYS